MLTTLFVDWLLSPQPPVATIFVLILALSLTFITTAVNRLLTHPEQLRQWREEIKTWTSEYKEAYKSKDKKKLAQAEKQKKRVMQLQQKMSWQSMKVSLLFFVPLLIVWQFLIGVYKGPVAFLPGMGAIPIVLWYLLCSVFFSTLLSKIFGVGLGAE
ncbi:MAG: EMC3/TMCO1 family protein [Candidatus Bathyarchaeia archaeon]